MKKSLENDIIPNLIENKKASGQKIKSNFFLDIGTPYYFIRASKILNKLFNKPAVFFDRDNTLIKIKDILLKLKI